MAEGSPWSILNGEAARFPECHVVNLSSSLHAPDSDRPRNRVPIVAALDER